MCLHFVLEAGCYESSEEKNVLIVQINGKLLVPDGAPCVSQLSHQNAMNQNLEML